MDIGEKNKNNQILVQKTQQKSTTHRFARIWAMQCNVCGYEYGSNSCDAHERYCSQCNPNVKPGEPLKML